MNIGNKISELRNHKGLTQEQLALESGLSKNAIWNYENNKRQPGLEALNKIAYALDADILDFFQGTKEKGKDYLFGQSYVIAKRALEDISYFDSLTKEEKVEYYVFDLLKILGVDELFVLRDDMKELCTKIVELINFEAYKKEKLNNSNEK